jgi:hypothetical protein
MYARVITFQVASAWIDEVVRRLQENGVPLAQQQRGFHSIMLLVDRESGVCQGITLWASAADREATGATSTYLRTLLATVVDLLVTTPVVANYDAGILVTATGEQPGRGEHTSSREQTSPQ